MIPKKGGAEDFKDYRPINLAGSLYKLLAKVLANRLKGVMRNLVNKAQNAFVGGRQILDALLIVNKVIDSMMKKKEKGILCKLDIEKAYDQINWNFLFLVLQKMGFGERWVSWLRWCTSTTSFSVLINGSPASFFKSSKGLRQGDPLSSYLFVLGMEAFSMIIERAVSEGFLSGYKITNRNGKEEKITHLFADDTLVFYRDSREKMVNLNWLLLWFKAIFGLRINLEKSFVLPMVEAEDLEALAYELGCKTTTLPITYLGLPLGMRKNSLSDWDGLEERFRKKLAI